MKKLLLSLMLLALAEGAAFTQSHEYAPLEEKTVNYRDWTFKSLGDDKPVNLREWAKGKKLLMVVYFAPWCGNWHNNAPVVARLYEKYKTQGLAVVGVSEYGSKDAVKQFFGPDGPAYPVVTESDDRAAREQTSHFGYRKLTGDGRNWGSPWHIFLEPAAWPAAGDTVTEKATVVNGELIEADADKFIAERLAALSVKPALPAKPAPAAKPVLPAAKPKKPAKPAPAVPAQQSASPTQQHAAQATIAPNLILPNNAPAAGAKPTFSVAPADAKDNKKPTLNLAPAKDEKDKTVKPCPGN